MVTSIPRSSPPGTFTNFTVGSAALTGWSVTGPDSGANVSIVSGTFAQSGVTFEAAPGNTQWLDLTGDGSNSTEGVSQVVSTTPGTKYSVSFYIGNTTGGGIFGTTSTVELFVNGSETAFTNSQVNATGLTWQQFTDTFLATGTSTTLLFQNGDSGADNSNGLDNIVVTRVPEPATLSLFCLGLAGIFMRRRKAT